ncbi:cytidine/deoxycytidylate deaminase [Burkholderia pseudomallei]|nr:cytidine/deoxycytidylate deaminase [Burkholderia pseudomallei]
MSTSVVSIQQNSTRENKSGDVKSTLEKRASREIVIAFMGAVGCGLPRAITECERQLKNFGYDVVRVKLSEFLKSHKDRWAKELDPEDSGVGYLENQTIGNLFRHHYSNDILAQYAISQVTRIKFARSKDAGDSAKELPQTAYIIDQLKHPEEANLLRLTYRNLFYLVGVLSTYEHRLTRLKDGGLPVETATRIMERDRKESAPYGQQLEKAFKLADYFIQHPLGLDDAIPKQVTRFLDLVHGSNAITPTRHEHAMYVAHASGVKSACFSRQVGASILDAKGKLIAVGCNDVPQYGGGLYTSENKGDQRCVNREGKFCENDKEKRLRKEKIRDGLKGDVSGIFKDAKTRLAVEQKVDEIVELAYKYSGIPDLIEFSRAVHAEMDAIVSVARQGGATTVGGTLYTTTFPCHNCARHIVAAGIDRVYYIEPYEKSLALTAHGDSIIVLDHDGDYSPADAINEKAENKVKFIHFAGAAPRVYSRFFQRDSRKDDFGYFVERSGDQPNSKIMVEYLDSYRDFELKVSQRFEDEFPVDATKA